MNAPPRPDVKPEPAPADFQDQAVPTIRQAIDDLYEAAFANGDRHDVMDRAEAAPGILQDALHELFYLRAELTRRETAAPPDPVADDDAPELTDLGEQAVAANPKAEIFNRLVAAELLDAREQFPPLTSLHQAFAVIKEQFDGFWKLLCQRRRATRSVLDKLVKTAAMCQRTAEDLPLFFDIAPALRAAVGIQRQSAFPDPESSEPT